MPHADSSFVPGDIRTKEQFYAHVAEQLRVLLEGSTYWVSNLAQASSLLYHSFLSSPLFGWDGNSPVVNWVGFYLRPSPSFTSPRLLLGPYNGRPACQSVNPIRGKGVCADAFVTCRSVVVSNVDEYPGHIACDGDTKSEIVCPLTISLGGGQRKTVGVLDLDSTRLHTFDDDDRKGLEEVVRIVSAASDW